MFYMFKLKTNLVEEEILPIQTKDDAEEFLNFNIMLSVAKID